MAAKFGVTQLSKPMPAWAIYLAKVINRLTLVTAGGAIALDGSKYISLGIIVFGIFASEFLKMFGKEYSDETEDNINTKYNENKENIDTKFDKTKENIETKFEENEETK